MRILSLIVVVYSAPTEMESAFSKVLMLGPINNVEDIING